MITAKVVFSHLVWFTYFMQRPIWKQNETSYNPWTHAEQHMKETKVITPHGCSRLARIFTVLMWTQEIQ